MNKMLIEQIIAGYLTQREILVASITDTDYNQMNAFTKTQALKDAIADLDNKITNLLTTNK